MGTQSIPDTAIYLNMQQCEDFAPRGTEDPYFGPAGIKIVTAADALLRSRDYDEEHRKVLGSFGQKTLVLVRRETDGPGWFGIEKVI